MYIIRHTFTSHLVMRGEYLKAIQELLGDANIKTTMIYANVSPAYLSNVVAKLPSILIDIKNVRILIRMTKSYIKTC
jgi:site-specific recombinase XerD